MNLPTIEKHVPRPSNSIVRSDGYEIIVGDKVHSYHFGTGRRVGVITEISDSSSVVLRSTVPEDTSCSRVNAHTLRPGVPEMYFADAFVPFVEPPKGVEQWSRVYIVLNADNEDFERIILLNSGVPSKYLDCATLFVVRMDEPGGVAHVRLEGNPSSVHVAIPFYFLELDTDWYDSLVTEDQLSHHNQEGDKMTRIVSEDRLNQLFGPANTGTRKVPEEHLNQLFGNPNQSVEDTEDTFMHVTHRTSETVPAPKGLFGSIPGLNIGPVNDNSVRVSTQGLAIRQKDGNFAVYDRELGQMRQVFDFTTFNLPGMPAAFVLPKKTVAIGDLIIANDKYAYVTDIIDANINRLRLFYPATGTGGYFTPALNALGFNLFSKVVPVGESLFRGRGGNLLLPLLMNSQNGTLDTNQLMPLLLTQGLGGGSIGGGLAGLSETHLLMLASQNGGQMSPFMSLLLLQGLDGNGGGLDITTLMMLTGGFGGGNGAFGGNNMMSSLLMAKAIGGGTGGLGNIDPMLLMLMQSGGGAFDQNTLAFLLLSGGLDDATSTPAAPAATTAPAAAAQTVTLTIEQLNAMIDERLNAATAPAAPAAE